MIRRVAFQGAMFAIAFAREKSGGNAEQSHQFGLIQLTQTVKELAG